MIRKALAALGVFAGVAVAANVAYAMWNTTGGGSGSAKAVSAQAVVVTGVDGAAQLYPGGSGDLRISVNTPNSSPVVITTVTGGTITSDQGAACNASTGVTFDNQTGKNFAVPAGQSASFTLTGTVHMSNASDNSCQGAVFTVPVTVSGGSAAS